MIDIKEKSIKSYNKKADNYDKSFDGRFTVKFKELLLGELDIKDEDKILDVACGNGTLLKMISEKANVLGCGIDISDKMIENAKVKCKGMIFEVSGCDETSFQEEHFDIVTVCAAYHHFPEVKAFAKEMYRIIKPKGKLYIAEVNYPAIIRAIVNLFIQLSPAGDVKIYSAEEIIANFKEQGFKEIGVKINGNIQIIKFEK